LKTMDKSDNIWDLPVQEVLASGGMTEDGNV
jgi:hypothetical protein